MEEKTDNELLDYLQKKVDDGTLEERWLDQETNIMRVKRLRYLGYSDKEIKKIKTGEEADKIIEDAKKRGGDKDGNT